MLALLAAMANLEKVNSHHVGPLQSKQCLGLAVYPDHALVPAVLLCSVAPGQGQHYTFEDLASSALPDTHLQHALALCEHKRQAAVSF